MHTHRAYKDRRLVPLEKCTEPAKLNVSLKQLAVSEEGDLEDLKRRVWVSAEDFADNGGATEDNSVRTTGRDADRSAQMPWMRWQEDGLDPRREHKELAEWRETSFTNEQFEAYYRRQGLLDDERQWPLFLEHCGARRRRHFGCIAHTRGAEALRKKLQAGLFRLSSSHANTLRAWKWRGKRLAQLKLGPGLSHWEIADQQPFGGNGLHWHSNAGVAAQASGTGWHVTSRGDDVAS